MSLRASSLSAVAVLLATLVIAQATSTPSLSDIVHSKRFPSVSTASVSGSAHAEENYGYESYGIETKELCLQETEQKTCSWVSNCGGTPDGGAPVQPNCVIGQYWTSDFSCCTEQPYGGYDNPSGLRNSQLWAGSTSIGTCDWTILYVDADSAPNFQITQNIDKLGTAWATCYLGPESDSCGGPLCDRMVMSLQGTAYYAAQAYSHYGESPTLTGNCAAVGGNPTGTAGNGGGANREADREANGTTVGARRSVARRQPVAVQPPTATGEFAELQNSGYGHGGDHYGGYQVVQQIKKDVYRGEATIIMGVVTSMAGQRKEKWDEGVFEYVPNLVLERPTPTAAPVPFTGGLDGAVPWVRDKTYKLSFFRGDGRSS